MADAPDRISVGYVRRAHGLSGDVILRPQSDDPDRFAVGATFETDQDQSRKLTIAEIRQHKEGLLLRFAEIADRDSADALRGAALTIGAHERRNLDDDEYWPEDLVGLRVVTGDGSVLGTVKDVVTGSAQDRLVVATDSNEVEVPFVAALVPEVNLAAGHIVVEPPAGLFD